MQTTVTYRTKLLSRLIPVLAGFGLIRKETGLFVLQAVQEQGDGGVDVTGAPISYQLKGLIALFLKKKGSFGGSIFYFRNVSDSTPLSNF